MKFAPGRLLATPGALRVLERNRVSYVHLIARHLAGDWGDVCASDKRLNDEALSTDCRVLSAYNIGGEKLYVITEWDRSVTTLLKADEY